MILRRVEIGTDAGAPSLDGQRSKRGVSKLLTQNGEFEGSKRMGMKQAKESILLARVARGEAFVGQRPPGTPNLKQTIVSLLSQGRIEIGPGGQIVELPRGSTGRSATGSPSLRRTTSELKPADAVLGTDRARKTALPRPVTPGMLASKGPSASRGPKHVAGQTIWPVGSRSPGRQAIKREANAAGGAAVVPEATQRSGNARPVTRLIIAKSTSGRTKKLR